MYDRLIERSRIWEERLGPFPMAVIFVLGLMVLAAVYVRPAMSTAALGNHYAWLSEDPLRNVGGNQVSYRMLTPVISYLLGLRGQLIIVTNLILAATLIGLVYSYFRKLTGHAGEALLAAGTMTFSLVTLTTVYYGGYCDSLTYLLVFLMWWQRSRSVLFYTLFLLALLNRECVLFLIPWFVHLRITATGWKWSTLVEVLAGLGIALLVFFCYRQWVESQGNPTYTVMYYLGPLPDDPLHWVRRSLANWGVGFFSVFKALWAVPVVAFWDLWRRGNRQEVIGMALLLFGVWSQMIIAFDTSRMLTLAFPVMLISLTYLVKTNAGHFRQWVLPLFLMNLLIPQLYTAAGALEVMHSTPVNAILTWFFGKGSW